MKICFITSSLEKNSGWGRYSLDLINEIQKNKEVKIKVLMGRQAGKSRCRDVEISSVLPTHTTIIKSILWLLINFRKMRRKIKNCDIVHCLVEPYAILTALLCFDKPYFITLHGTFGIKYLEMKKTGFVFKWAIRHAVKNICISSFTRKKIQDKVKTNNLIVINNGINFKYFYKKDKFFKRKLNKKVRLMGVGTLKRRKGFDLVIKALFEVCKKNNNFEYVLVGDQADIGYYESLKKLTQSLGLTDKIIFKTNLSEGELIEEYYNADIFILTPITVDSDFEGFGLVYLEANACGVPVIGTVDGGAVDAIKDGYSGILVNTNVDDIAHGIMRLMENGQVRKRMGENGVLWASEQNWGKRAQEYLNCYKNNFKIRYD